MRPLISWLICYVSVTQNCYLLLIVPQVVGEKWGHYTLLSSPLSSWNCCTIFSTCLSHSSWTVHSNRHKIKAVWWRRLSFTHIDVILPRRHKISQHNSSLMEKAFIYTHRHYSTKNWLWTCTNNRQTTFPVKHMISFLFLFLFLYKQGTAF